MLLLSLVAGIGAPEVQRNAAPPPSPTAAAADQMENVNDAEKGKLHPPPFLVRLTLHTSRTQRGNLKRSPGYLRRESIYEEMKKKKNKNGGFQETPNLVPWGTICRIKWLLVDAERPNQSHT